MPETKTTMNKTDQSALRVPQEPPARWQMSDVELTLGMIRRCTNQPPCPFCKRAVERLLEAIKAAPLVAPAGVPEPDRTKKGKR